MKKKPVSLSKEAIDSLIELGEVLRDIHNRLLREGKIRVEDGKVIPITDLKP